MRIYIATKFENTDQFNLLKRKLEKNGHTITHDWTKESSAGHCWPEKYAYLQKCAKADLDGVISAEAIVFIPFDDKPMVGAYVEVGIALGLSNSVSYGTRNRRVIVIDGFSESFPGKNNIFWFLPEIEHVGSIDAAVELLGRSDKF